MSYKFFYDGFLINKNKYIASTLLEQLEIGEESSTFRKLNKSDRDHTLKDYEFALKTQIRFLCLLSIESLFELIQALIPNENPTSFNDKLIIEQILSSHNNILHSFMSGFISINDSNIILDRIIQNDYSVGHHIFYFNIDGSMKYPDDLIIKDSLQNIKLALSALSSEMNDRNELNAFKHGDRIFPYLKGIIFQNLKTGEMLPLEFGNSLTFFSKSKDPSNGYGINLNSINPYADYGKIVLVNKLLECIISPRKYYFVDKSTLPNTHKFDKEAIDKLLSLKG